MKLELLTNATVVDDAIRFVEERTRFISHRRDNEESKEPDHSRGNEELEEGQEKNIGETEERITTNQVF
jgi:hypothetical protein